MPEDRAKVWERVLIVGHRGMLARAIERELDRRGVAWTGVDRDTFDVTDGKQVAALFERVRPTLAINCAAYTNVDGCETDENTANAVNGEAVGLLAEAAKSRGTKVVHFSTDFVFDGRSDRAYRPDDATNPLSAYGRSKLLGEKKLRQVDPAGWLIVRTAWLYGEDGNCFPKTMLNAAKAGKALKVVSDQIGCPTWTGDLAAATLDLVGAGAGGVFHGVNGGQCSWYEFARAIFEVFGVSAEVSPQTSAEWTRIKPGAAVRPGYSVLDVSSTEAVIGRRMRSWREALRDHRDQRVQRDKEGKG